MNFKALVPKSKVIRKYLSIINCSLNLTERELDVLALIISMELSWDNVKEKNIIDTNSRRYIMQNTYINKNNLSKYIKKYKEKELLVEYLPKKWRVNENVVQKDMFLNDTLQICFLLNIF